jgi:hypothetical protein
LMPERVREPSRIWSRARDTPSRYRPEPRYSRESQGTITDLEPGQRYTFQIQARTKVEEPYNCTVTLRNVIVLLCHSYESYPADAIREAAEKSNCTNCTFLVRYPTYVTSYKPCGCDQGGESRSASGGLLDLDPQVVDWWIRIRIKADIQEL